MKVNRVYLHKLNMNTTVPHISEGSENTITTNKEYADTVYSYRPINFKGIDTIAFIGELKSLEDLHCPLCGTKMLSSNEANLILNEADKVDTPEQFCNFLDKHAEYINPELKAIIKDAKMQFYKSNTPDINIFLNNLKTIYEKKETDEIVKTKEYIQNIINSTNLSTQDKKILEQCSNDITFYANKKTKASFYNYINSTLKNSLKLLQSDEKYNIYPNIAKPLKKVLRYELLFKPNPREYVPQIENLQKTVLRNIIHYAKSDLHKANTMVDVENGSIFNMLLTCEHCITDKKNIYKLKGSEQTKHYYIHLQELAQAALNGKLNSNKAYPITLANFIRETSKQKITPDDNDALLNKLSELTGIEKKSKPTFSIANQHNIPCASCGQETITYEEKNIIFEKIKQSTNLSEINTLIQQNKKYLKNRYIELINEFDKQLSNNPLLNGDKFITYLRKNQNNKIKKELNNCKNFINNSTTTTQYSYNDKKLIEKFNFKINNIIQNLDENIPFDYDDYHQLTNDTISKIQISDKENVIIQLRKNLKDLHLTQQILFPEPLVVKKVGSKLKVFAQDLFKSSISTPTQIDKSEQNLEKLKNKSSNSKTVIMCKNCTTDKRKKDLKYWQKLHPEIKENLPKYLKKVKELSKENKIEGFDLYPYEIINTVKELTDGNLDISLNLD